MTQISTASNTKTIRTVLTVAFTVAALATQISSASAFSASVTRACTGDYLSYCSHISPTSSKLNGCMRAAGPKLSNRCVSALVKAGLVSKAETKQRTARRH